LQLRLLPAFVKDSDWAGIYTAGVNHTHTTGTTFLTGNKPSHLNWQSGASYYYRGYQERDEEESQFAIGINQSLWQRGRTKLDLIAEVLYTDHTSNVCWYDYDRTQSVVTLSLTF